MPRLPDENALGGLPSANSGRPISSIDASPIGRGMESVAAGIRNLGQGVASGIDAYASRNTTLEDARANAAWSIAKAKTDDERTDETDPEALASYRDKYQQALQQAAAHISDPAKRELFLTRNSPEVEKGQIAADTSAWNINRDRGLAADQQTLTDLMNVGITKKDPSMIAKARAIYDAQHGEGYISAVEAQQRKQQWVQNYGKRTLDMAEPEERLKMLGASHSPVDVAKAFEGVSETSHPEVLTDFFRKTGGQAIDPRETAWCAAFADAVLGASGKAQRGSLRAADFLSYGAPTDAPSRGDVVVFKPQAQGSSGHVGFVVGVEGGQVRYIAGNDGNKVQEDTMPLSEVAGFRVPPKAGTPLPPGTESAEKFGERVAAKVGPAKPSPLVSFLPPDVQQQYVEGARSEILTKNREAEKATAAEIASVKSMVGDDQSSLMATGKPVEGLDTDRVARALGPAAAAAFQQQRKLATDYYTQTHDFEEIPTAAMGERLDALKPQPGAPGYDAQQRYYDQAVKRAQDVVKRRNEDPSAAVDDLPDVKSFKQGVSFEQPESYRPLVKARIQAQERIGVPEDLQTPITRAEARALMVPVQRALPGQEREALTQVMQTVKAAFGDQSDAAIEYMLREAKVEKETRATAAVLFKKLGLGESVTQDDARALDEAQKADAAAKAVAGIPPAEGGVMRSVARSLVAPGVQPESLGARAGALIGADPNMPRQPTPDDEDIQMLRQNPQLRAKQFDAVYGTGAAEKVLKVYPPSLGMPPKAKSGSSSATRLPE